MKRLQGQISRIRVIDGNFAENPGDISTGSILLENPFSEGWSYQESTLFSDQKVGILCPQCRQHALYSTISQSESLSECFK